LISYTTIISTVFEERTVQSSTFKMLTVLLVDTPLVIV